MPYTFNPLSETFDFYKDPTPGGTSGQVQFNNSGVLGGVSTTAVDGSGNLTFSGRWIQSTNGASNAAPYILTGTWFSGGDSTTTKPQLLIEPTGTTSNTWSTAGTGFGVNAPSGFTGNLATFGINGTERMRITASGNVGIGTTSPSGLLHLSSTTIAETFISATGAGGRTWRIGTGDTSSGLGGAFRIYDQTGTAERVRITTSGNVGIGTTTPGVLLEVNGAMTAQGNIFAASGGTTRTITLGPAGAGLEYNTDGTTYLGGRTDAYPLVFRTNSAERLRITSGGNVGIGAASPLAKLEVKGSTLISTTNNGNNILGFNDVAFAGGTLNGAPDGASGSAFIVGNGSTASGAPSYLSMWTTNGGVVSERMRITSTGNVGIGTASPTAKLEVNNGDIVAGNAANNFRILVSRTGANPSSLVIGAFTDSPAIEFTGALGLRFLAGLGGTEVMRIRNNNLGIGTGNPLSKLVISDSGAQGFEFDPSTGIFQVYNRSTSAYGELRPYGSLIRFFTGTSPSERMRLDASGNLGIGTASPLFRLHVSSADTSLVRYTGAEYAQVQHSDGTRVFYTQVYNNMAVLGTATNTPIMFAPDNTERMRLDTSGNVGIGTTSPAVKLEVNGQIRTEAPTGGTAANWRLGTVHTVTPTSPNRTIEVDIGGTIYYLHAKTTNN